MELRRRSRFHLTMIRFAGFRIGTAVTVFASVMSLAVGQDSQPAAASTSQPSVQTGANGVIAPSPSAPNPIVAAPGPAKPAAAQQSTPMRRSRVISPEVAAQLAAAVPKYAPPPPPKPEQAPDDETDLREVDKPKNGIVRLPKYVVRQPRPAVLSERAVNTEKGLADLAMKRYITEGYRALNSFTLPLFGSSASQYALGRYEEDERLKNMSDLNDSARMVSATDKASGVYVKKEVDQTFIRPGDFDWRPLGR